MHILILPSFPYQTEYLPLAGIFQRHQAECLAAAGHKAGVLSAGLLPFSAALKTNKYARVEQNSQAGVSAARRFGKAWLPQRFLSPDTLAKAAVRLGLEAFEAYLRLNGMPDVAHAHDCLYAGALALALKQKYGLPYVVTEHSSAHLRGILSAQQERFVREALSGASTLMTVGSAAARLLGKKYGDLPAAKHVEIVYNLLEASFEDAGLPPASTQGGFTFLNIANLSSVKRQEDLILALRKVLAKHPGARLRIGGAGPERPALERQIDEAGLQGSVRLLGLLNRGQVMAEMAACDAFALSSQFETFGVVLIEAMALGKPVVSTASGGPEDIVDETCGILTPVGDIEALAGTMARMIEEKSRFDAAAIRDRCIGRFGREAFLKKLEGVYRDALTPQP